MRSNTSFILELCRLCRNSWRYIFKTPYVRAVEKNWVLKWGNRETVDKRKIVKMKYIRRNKHGTKDCMVSNLCSYSFSYSIGGKEGIVEEERKSRFDWRQDQGLSNTLEDDSYHFIFYHRISLTRVVSHIGVDYVVSSAAITEQQNGKDLWCDTHSLLSLFLISDK